MIHQLVVNGCSYMDSYAQGGGHVDLAQRLGIDNSASIAVSGSANSRILRTTLKHSYQSPPTLYVLGMTFLSRLEIPICVPENEFEGRWTNPQNQEYKQRWQYGWSQTDSNKFVEIKLKTEIYSILDRIEDLMYRICSTVTDLQSRGHKVLVYQQADNLYQQYLSDPRLKWFRRPEIIDGFAWRATEWQHNQGVKPTIYHPDAPHVPPDMTHPESGCHDCLNQYLTSYIQQHKILS